MSTTMVITNAITVEGITCVQGCTCDECMSHSPALTNMFDVEIAYATMQDEDYPF